MLRMASGHLAGWMRIVVSHVPESGHGAPGLRFDDSLGTSLLIFPSRFRVERNMVPCPSVTGIQTTNPDEVFHRSKYHSELFFRWRGRTSVYYFIAKFDRLLQSLQQILRRL